MTRHSTHIPLSIVLLLMVLAPELLAQQPIAVPRDSAEIVIAGKRISVSYGRPSMLGRTIMGDYVPYNRVWRTGAGAATVLSTEADLELGGIEIPKGAYSLYTFPTSTQWKLIVNKQTGQWGTIYSPQQDLARIALQKRLLQNTIEKLTFVFERASNASGVLKIEWENTSLSIPFKVSPIPIVASPRDSVKATFLGHTVSVTYGRPSARGRKIFGGVVPYNQIWRTGANEATTFRTDADLMMGGAVIPKGSYSLYTLPSRSTWQLIVNKEVGQSGLVYHQRMDLTRLKLRKSLLNNVVERFTIAIEKKTENDGILRLEWEKTALSIPFTLKAK